MLRLWRRRLRASLFPGAAWVLPGKLTRQVPTLSDNSDEWDVSLLDELALQCLQVGGTGRDIDLLVSDRLARCITLPWQDQPLNPEQQHAYAVACLEHAGMLADGSWAIHGGFRHFGHPGLAMAVRTEWLAEATCRFATHGLHLGNVTPVTAAAYWSHSCGGRRTSGLLLLAERGRITAMRSNAGKFRDIDVEPAGADSSLALRRLLRRTIEVQSPIDVRVWQATTGLIDETLVREQFPGVRIRFLATGIWNR